MFTLDEASIVSIFLESLLFGAFAVLYFTTLYVLLGKRRRAQSINVPMLITTNVMFILGVVHLGVDMQRAWNGFITYRDEDGGPVAYFDVLSDPLYVLKSTAYCMQTLVGDGFVIYRLAIVWGRDKRILIPALICYTASVGVGIGALQGFARAKPGEAVFINELKNWIVSFFALTLCQNFVCTSLIAARIWWVNRLSKGVISTYSLMPVVIVVIESGTLYSVTLITLLSVYLSGNYAQYVVLDATTQIIGIVFSLIIVRVGLGLTAAETYAPSDRLSTLAAAGVSGLGEQTQPEGFDGGRSVPLTVNIARKHPYRTGPHLHRNGNTVTFSSTISEVNTSTTFKDHGLSYTEFDDSGQKEAV